MLLVGVVSMTACKKDEGTLTVSTNAAFAPFEYKENGEFKGIDMEIAKYIADKMNMKLKVEDMEFDSVLTAVASGNADIGMAGLTINDKRKETNDFCTPYYNASQYVVARIGDTSLDACTTIAEVEAILAGKKIGTQNGTTGYFYVSGNADFDYPGIPGATAMPFGNGALAAMDLINKNCDYVVIDNMPAKILVEKQSDKLKLIPISLTDESYAFAVKKGNDSLRNKVNEIMAEMTANGELAKIIAKYFA